MFLNKEASLKNSSNIFLVKINRNVSIERGRSKGQVYVRSNKKYCDNVNGASSNNKNVKQVYMAGSWRKD